MDLPFEVVSFSLLISCHSPPVTAIYHLPDLSTSTQLPYSYLPLHRLYRPSTAQAATALHRPPLNAQRRASRAPPLSIHFRLRPALASTFTDFHLLHSFFLQSALLTLIAIVTACSLWREIIAKAVVVVRA
jgi:hypothetical protein